ncbi:MAG: hypothetical protein OEQ39_24255 [Gammaproteobacteria bacterium]|nr:hypothetical protein [Gammaproteobacteria bacterium]MDH3380046.1 hypothetical protein [Gammaproteobacteria bacterium]
MSRVSETFIDVTLPTFLTIRMVPGDPIPLFSGERGAQAVTCRYTGKTRLRAALMDHKLERFMLIVY